MGGIITKVKRFCRDTLYDMYYNTTFDTILFSVGFGYLYVVFNDILIYQSKLINVINQNIEFLKTIK